MREDAIRKGVASPVGCHGERGWHGCTRRSCGCKLSLGLQQSPLVRLVNHNARVIGDMLDVEVPGTNWLGVRVGLVHC